MNDIFMWIGIIYLIVNIIVIIWVCSEAENRKDASVFRTAIISLFFSPIAGMVYLLLFPRLDMDKKGKMPEPMPKKNIIVSKDRNIQKGDVVINLRNGKELYVDGINDDGRYICYVDKNKVYTSLFAADEIATKEEYSKLKEQ